MPLFFFDVHDARGRHPDVYGVDLADQVDACEQCQGLLNDVLREELPGTDLHVVTCEVRDESGRVIYRGELSYRGERP